MSIEHEFQVCGYYCRVSIFVRKHVSYFEVEIPKTWFRDLIALLLGGKSEIRLGYRVEHYYVFPDMDVANHFLFLQGLEQKSYDDYIPF